MPRSALLEKCPWMWQCTLVGKPELPPVGRDDRRSNRAPVSTCSVALPIQPYLHGVHLGSKAITELHAALLPA